MPWYHKFARHIFLVTDYMRSWEEIDWTPEPDMWHDMFGHLPLMTLPHYAALEDLFAPAFLAANDEQREIKSRLMSIMFARFPLIDPDRFLKTFQPLAKLVIGPVGAVRRQYRTSFFLPVLVVGVDDHEGGHLADGRQRF